MRWWLSFGLFYFGLLAFVAGLFAPLFNLPVFWSIAAAALLYPVGVLIGFFPPGRPDTPADDLRPQRGIAARLENHPAPPEGYQDELEAEYRLHRPQYPWLVGLVVLAFVLGLLAWAVVAPWLDDDEGPRRAAAPEATATATLTATLSPTRTASPSPTATSTPTPEPTPEPTATPVPATPTNTPSTPVAQSAPPLTGQWEVVDRVTFGQDTGSVFRFAVALVQSGSNVTGSGSGLSLQGARSGDTVRLDFVRDGNKTGYFSWTVQPNGTLAGTFEDYGAANGGTSTATRQ